MNVVVPTDTFYKHLHVDIPYTYMKYVVGKKGAHFKKCKETIGVDSVWYNVKRNLVEIYGPKNKLEDASYFLQKRIDNMKKKIPNEELKQFQNTLIKSFDTHIAGSLEGALTRDQVKYLIGKKGKNFKTFTKETEVSFIWYDDEKHSIMIWGPQENLEKAVHKLFEQIERVKNGNISTNDVEMTDD